ncbi:MAG: hypothetical protein IID44_25825 [Planctomycetes bacterium]|nr:hypothetical protein [Planctomycetota bacterium]
MNDSDDATKSCDPQLLQGEPLKTWTVDELGQYAEAQQLEIENCEKALAPVYWQLGKALNLARENFGRGQWSRFLEQWAIDKTRASKARAIQRTFKTPQKVENMSVQEAYGRRKRQPRRKRPRPSATTSPKRREHVMGLGDWLFDVCQQANVYFDEAAHSTPEQATSLRGVADAAVGQLQRLRDQLEHQAHDSNDRETLNLSGERHRSVVSTPQPKESGPRCHK